MVVYINNNKYDIRQENGPVETLGGVRKYNL